MLGKYVKAEMTPSIKREKERADMEKERADIEKERADTEKERSDAAELEIQRLKKELEKRMHVTGN